MPSWRAMLYVGSRVNAVTSTPRDLGKLRRHSMVENTALRVAALLLPIVAVALLVSASAQQPPPLQMPPAPSDGRVHLKGKPASVTVAQPGTIPVLSATVVKSYPHDPHAFTQGLEFFDGFLYESTGRAKQSTLRKVVLETGKV